MLCCYHDVVSLRASCMVSLVLNFNLLYGFCSSPRLFFGDRIYKETKDEKEGGHEEVKQYKETVRKEEEKKRRKQKRKKKQQNT